MILGIGIDIIEIDRMAQVIQRQGKQFITRLFTVREQIPPEEKVGEFFIAQHYAARFAAKEAVTKALGTGFRGIGWKDIEILKSSLGKPYVALSESIAERFSYPELLLSISHSKNNACAVCLWQAK